MRIQEHIDALRRDGGALAGVAAETDLDASVPTCPEWKVRDLVRHVGGVHHWAAAYVTTARAAARDDDGDLERVVGGWPSDAALVEWFRMGHVALVAALQSAPEDLACWTFLPAPSPRAFWARRQAHETAVHLADAWMACGESPAYPPAFAADGVDELLLGFGGRHRSGMRTTTERTLTLRATDLDARWHVRLTPGDPGGIVTSSEDAAAECAVAATASDLYLLLWNRRSTAGLHVEGDRDVLDGWRQQVQITWS